MKELTVKFEGMDWNLLRRQKEMLLTLIKDQKPEDEFFDVNGVVHLIDKIQDTAVESEQATEEKVFGKEKEEELTDPLNTRIIMTKRQEMELCMAEAFLTDEDREVIIAVGVESGHCEALVTRYVDEELGGYKEVMVKQELFDKARERWDKTAKGHDWLEEWKGHGHYVQLFMNKDGTVQDSIYMNREGITRDMAIISDKEEDFN